MLGKHGLVVEGIDMAGAAIHEEKDDSLGFGSVVGGLSCKRALMWISDSGPIQAIEKSFLTQHPGQCEGAESSAYG